MASGLRLNYLQNPFIYPLRGNGAVGLLPIPRLYYTHFGHVAVAYGDVFRDWISISPWCTLPTLIAQEGLLNQWQGYNLGHGYDMYTSRDEGGVSGGSCKIMVVSELSESRKIPRVQQSEPTTTRCTSLEKHMPDEENQRQ